LTSVGVETSASEISFVRARCSSASEGGAERARQIVIGRDEHLSEG
jgi:hypothetical protein